ncbi:MAG: serine/threonine-protein kinase, partial [Planctomycetes bacterium]|nr:serine/threonine-protein kinase [Planctomycetota bacterium]
MAQPQHTIIDPAPNPNFSTLVDTPNADATNAATLVPATGLHDETIIPSQPIAQFHASKQTYPGYEIISILGEGGMGRVYKARQIALNRTVALKVIRQSSGAIDILARFKLEGEALAGIQHANIVQIFQVGDFGNEPFLALEYVDGGSLQGRLKGEPQPFKASADLIAVLSRAMHVAHQKGIVHRDLKPANILLGSTDASAANPTEFGFPKITDFGLAKRFELEEAQSQTQSGDILGTPAYMAPEQAAGNSRNISPRTDIFALGTILYELLTGKPPFRGATALETIKQVLELDPVAPKQLRPDVPRDLETICLKCLEKEPRKRYDSAADLADDLKRFLANEPIIARPAGRIELLVKFIRRHPQQAISIGLITVMLVLGLTGAVWHTVQVRAERDRAERSADLALQAIDETLTVVGEEHVALEPRMEEKRRALLEIALVFYERLQAEQIDSPKLKRQRALGQKKLGDILRLLGRSDDAQRAYMTAIDRLEPLLKQKPDDLDLQQAKAHCFNFLGEIHRQAGRIPEARTSYQKAEQILEGLNPNAADRMPIASDLARTQYNLGLLRREAGELDEAVTELAASIKSFRGLVDRAPNDLAYRQHLARALLNLGTVKRLKNDRPGAIADTNEAIEILETLRKQYSSQPDFQHELAVARNNLGNYFAQEKRLKEAVEEHTNAAELFRALARDFPKIPVYRQERANSLNSLGVARAGMKELDQARVAWEESTGLLEELLSQSGAAPTTRGVLGTTLGNLGKLNLIQKDYPAAWLRLDNGLQQLALALGPNPDQPDYLRGCRGQAKDLAEAIMRGGESKEALTISKTIAEQFGNSVQGQTIALVFLARCLSIVEKTIPEANRTSTTARLTEI